jgi:hypothetical protein
MDPARIERAVQAVLKMSDVVRGNMEIGNVEGGKKALAGLTKFFEDVPASFTARIVFLIANQAMYGDAFVWKETDGDENSGH